MKKLNTVMSISRLNNELAERVRSKEAGLFRNTIIKDGDTAYGYGRDGTAYLIDSEDSRRTSKFIWYQNENGYMVTDNVRDEQGHNMPMDEFIMGLWDV